MPPSTCCWGSWTFLLIKEMLPKSLIYLEGTTNRPCTTLVAWKWHQKLVLHGHHGGRTMCISSAGGGNVHGTASRFCSHEHAPLKIPRNHHLEIRAHQKQDHCRKLAGWTGHFFFTWVLFQQTGKTSRTPTHWDRPWVPWNPRRRLCTAKERQMDRREVSKEIFS